MQQQCERFVRDGAGELQQCLNAATVCLTMCDRSGEYDEYLCAECAEVMRLIVEADPEVSIHYEVELEQVAA